MTIQFRRGAATFNPVLAVGEPGFQTSTGKFKIGDGTTAWDGLPTFAHLSDITAVAPTPTAVKTTGYTAVVGDLIPADATAGGFTITLPAAPADKSVVLVKKIDSSANAVTVQRSGSDVFNIAGGASTLQLVLQDQTVSLQYKASGAIWYVTSHGNPVAGLDARYVPAASASNIQFDRLLSVNGNQILDFDDVALSTTYVQLQTSDTANHYVQLRALGTPSTIPFFIYPKSAPLYIYSSSGTDAALIADGPESDKPLHLNSRGSAYVTAGSSSGIERIIGPLASRTTQFSLASSTTETDIITATLPTGLLVAGSTFRIRVNGTIQTQATSGTLTFKPYLGANAASQTFQIPSIGGALAQMGFTLDVDITVRTTGSSGTYIAHGFGIWPQGGWYPLTSTASSTAVVNTTSATPVVKLSAVWQTSSATNILQVETATIEQVV